MIKAPLCRPCADMLRGTVFAVDEIAGQRVDQCVCPWCQRKEPAAVFRILIQDREGD